MFKRSIRSGLILFLAFAASLQAQYTVLHEFVGDATDGGGAYGALIKKGAALYGMTPWGGSSDKGTIFKINANGSGYAILHSFTGEPADGEDPYGTLYFNGGKLYGMTEYGGADNLGTIFRINLNGSGFTVLHHFAGGATDGAVPVGSLTFFGGQFYGVTSRGGSENEGTIFRISPKGTGFAVLHSFTSSSGDGYFPHGALKAMGKKLYGMTSAGGTDGLGTIFRIDTTGAGYVLLHSFTDSETDGTIPNLGSLVAKGTILYGMTSPDPHSPPAGGGGTIFKINTNGTGFAILHSFSGEETDGEFPYGSLRFSGSQLYGTTCYGGADDNGTIFRIGVNGAGFTVLHSFDYDNGAYPKGDLLVSGKLVYGMTDYGGASDWGVIFSYKIK